jgi:high-affinity nickel-transport protein
MSFALIPGAETGSLLAAMAATALLGLKHGFDADHLAAIDAVGRVHRQAGRLRAAAASGALFSGGHALVMLAAALLAFRAGGTLLPDWLDAAGAWLSIGCLSLIGMLSIRSADHHRPGPLAWRRALLGRLLPSDMPAWSAALVGGLFAFSLDTLATAAMFAGSGARLGGWPAVALLGLAFAAGMLMADGLSGWWVNRLSGAGALQQRRGRRLAGWLVGLAALFTAALGAARQLAPALDDWADSHALGVGLALLLATSLSLVAAAAYARLRPG